MNKLDLEYNDDLANDAEAFGIQARIIPKVPVKTGDTIAHPQPPAELQAALGIDLDLDPEQDKPGVDYFMELAKRVCEAVNIPFYDDEMDICKVQLIEQRRYWMARYARGTKQKKEMKYWIRYHAACCGLSALKSHRTTWASRCMWHAAIVVENLNL